MGHDATVLEDGDTLYIGVLHTDGSYSEVRLSNTQNQLLVTQSGGDGVIFSGFK